MTDKIRIFCVDDDEVNRLMLEGALSEYECILLESGRNCLKSARATAPDLILLDVDMPEMGGLETCRQLRELPELAHIPVIFLSSHDTLEDRLNGYTAGGDDYLCKPFENDELIAKVKASLARKVMLDNARRDAKEAALSISDIMTTMGEMSTVVNFFQNTFSCRSYDALAQRIIDAHSTLGLDVVIELRVDEKRLHYSSNGTESPLEESVFEYIRSKGRLVNCGQRAAVNYPRLTIIIRNMPTHDPELQGRIRDHIALIAQGADSKVKALKSELLLKSQREELIQIVTRMEQTINEVESDYKQQQGLSGSIFTTVINTLEDSFMSLGLTEQQEQFQRNIIMEAERQSNDLYDAGLALEERFTEILQQIQQTLQQTALDEDDEGGDESDDMEADAVTLF